MKRLFFCMAACLLAFVVPVNAATVHLTDGSSVKGEVESLSGGVYVIQTESLGRITVLASRVRSITNTSRAPSGSGGVSSTGAASPIESIQASIAGNPGLISSVMQLQSDPQMQAVLADPELMRAVQSFDLETLRNHPKIRALMNNPGVRRIQDEVQ